MGKKMLISRENCQTGRIRKTRSTQTKASVGYQEKRKKGKRRSKERKKKEREE